MEKKNILKSLLSQRMFFVLLLGFSSGLPLLLIGSTMKTWLREEKIDLTHIGFFSIVGLPYTLKFLWAPLLDRYSLFGLDRRRGWIILCQLLLGLLFFALSFLSFNQDLFIVGIIAFLVSFASASQDIVIDAYRREVLMESELGLGASMTVNGYRLGMLFAGAGILFLSDRIGWGSSYRIAGSLFFLLACITLFAPKIIDGMIVTPRTLYEASILPFLEFFQRKGAIEIILFILLFKIGDQMASDMLGPFYLDMGFTKTEIAVVSKFFGFWSVILGGFLGGIILLKIGFYSSLWLFGVLQALSTAFFSFLPIFGKSIEMLSFVVGFENITSGMGTAAFVGYMSHISNKRFTATQYALLSSITGIPRVFFGSSSGYLAQHLGWVFYFIFCALIALPGLLMVFRIKSKSSSLAI